MLRQTLLNTIFFSSPAFQADILIRSLITDIPVSELRAPMTTTTVSTSVTPTTHSLMSMLPTSTAVAYVPSIRTQSVSENPTTPAGASVPGTKSADTTKSTGPPIGKGRRIVPRLKELPSTIPDAMLNIPTNTQQLDSSELIDTSLPAEVDDVVTDVVNVKTADENDPHNPVLESTTPVLLSSVPDIQSGKQGMPEWLSSFVLLGRQFCFPYTMQLKECYVLKNPLVLVCTISA